jgi:hypothetical protein
MIGKRYIGSMIGISALAVVATVAVNANGTLDVTSQTRTATVTAVPGLPGCDQEDGSTQLACYWDAQRMGNGKGWSMIHMDYGQQTIIVSWLPAPCKALSQLPAYSTPDTEEPSKIATWPSGIELISQEVEAGTKINSERMHMVCNSWLAAWADDHMKGRVINK